VSAASQVGGAPEPDIWRQVIDLGARLNVTQIQTDPTMAHILPSTNN
jgi:hypothetical protein